MVLVQQKILPPNAAKVAENSTCRKTASVAENPIVARCRFTVFVCSHYLSSGSLNNLGQHNQAFYPHIELTNSAVTIPGC